MDPNATYRRLVPVDRLASPVTPSDDVYVIAHMGIARPDLAQWRLAVDGLVERPFELDYAALTALPATEVTAVLECFGNPVEPEVATRRVGNVVWRGVRLAHLLERAGVRAEARYVCPEGLDSGSFANVHSERYVKDLPLARALEPDVLVAWAMNGAPLTPEHGFPARVFVPGYFGTNAVKWLSRITLAAERPESLFTTRLYNRREEGELRPVRELDVHAVIVTPADGTTLARGRHAIEGWAWSAWPVHAVDVSSDGGATWQPARVAPRGEDHQWQAFTYAWNAGTPGRYALHARATDERGRVQPAAGRNRIHTIGVVVEQQEGDMANNLDRRDFLAGLGVTIGGAALGVGGDLAVAGVAAAQDTAKGRIPETPVKFGHITIQSGPGAILGLPSLKGHTLAAEEINAAGGLLGRRKIETITADEAAGPEATVKEVKRMKLVEKIDYFSGVIAAHNQLAVGPVVEELNLLTIMTEGCIDRLFEIEVPNPHYLFGMTNILSADGVTTALAVAKAWPGVKRIAVVNPDYAFGRWFQLHFDAAREKLLPGSEIVSEVWAPFPGTTDFTSHITKTIGAKPDLVVTSMWGGMYVSFYKQALVHGLFRGARLAGNINFGVVPQAIGKDHPEGALAGVHSNYHFTYSPAGRSAANKKFVDAYQKRWNEYPSYAAEAAYTGLYFFKTAVERANRQAGGGWPEDEAIIKQLEGLSIEAPAGIVTIRKEDHRAFKDVKVGFSKNLPEYPFPVWDPERVMTIPVATMTAPPTWPKPGKGHNDPSATVNWIKTTWKKAGA